jgi:hypothetical protein
MRVLGLDRHSHGESLLASVAEQRVHLIGGFFL